jgi:hypothetical protein
MKLELKHLCNSHNVQVLGEEAVSFHLFEELYNKYIQMADRFESVHIWSEELAKKNKGRWNPIEISQAKYESEKLHSWNN